jgi:tRNA1(Val) A37 N6-methylase TrmN6
LFDGTIRVRQPRRGYRITIDTVLLGAFASTACRGPVARVVDLGAGIGGVTLSLHHFAGVRHADLIEVAPGLAALSRHNLTVAGVPHAVFEADVALGLPRPLRGCARAVVCNPPFFPERAGNPRLDPSARGARSGPLDPFVRAAALALGRRARAFFVYPAPALPELLAASRAHGLVAKRLRFVHAYATSPARIVLVELARAKPGGLVVEPPLVEWAAKGARGSELVALLSGRADDRRESPPPRGR